MWQLESLHPLHDPAMDSGVQSLVTLRARRVEIERIAGPAGIVALLRELLLAQLEGAGDLESLHDAQKEGAGILRQLVGELAPEGVEIELRADDQRGHSRPAL